MTIGIAIAVPDGIALAADTQTTWNRTILKAKVKSTGQEEDLVDPISIPIGWSRMARKLFSVSMADKIYSIITAGMAQMNSKSMFAIFRSFSQKYDGDGSVDDVSTYLRDCLVQELASHFSCKITDLGKKPINVSEYIIACYEEDDVTKPVVESHIAFSGTISIDGAPNSSGYFKKWSNRSQANRYGGCWIGRTEFISHIVNHKNKALPPISGQYGMMTLADAGDYTRFLIEYVCDFQRFAIMVPDCGRPITLATLTPDQFDTKTVGSRQMDEA